MGQSFQYLSERQWVPESSVWRPPEPIILRDEAGVVISSAQMATLVMTLFDLTDPTQPIVNGISQTDIKNVRGCTLSTQGVFVLTLQPADTVILQPVHRYELRRILVEFTWPVTPTKADCLELTVVIRNVPKRPYVAP